MDIWQAVALGIVEGVTEFLPVSSTGHLILADTLLGIPHTEFSKSFNIAIQLGAIASVVWLYWRKLFVEREVMKKIAAAFLPTAVVGALLYQFIKGVLLESEAVVVWALFLGGIFLILFELMHKEKGGEEDVSRISYAQALFVGAVQALSVVPGVSRAAATILGGLLVGLKRKTIVEFSFLLAVPTMLAATALDLSQSAGEFAAGDFSALAVGFAVSFAVAAGSITFLLRFIQTHTFIAFGAYRIFISGIFWFFVLS